MPRKKVVLPSVRSHHNEGGQRGQVAILKRMVNLHRVLQIVTIVKMVILDRWFKRKVTFTKRGRGDGVEFKLDPSLGNSKLLRNSTRSRDVTHLSS